MLCSIHFDDVLTAVRRVAHEAQALGITDKVQSFQSKLTDKYRRCFIDLGYVAA